ncbi:MAG: hypothetical protein IKP77_03420 [Acholeplasmatales bacterium]|nr:hypothetical protein [Acholeplasmatales bacterium]
MIIRDRLSNVYSLKNRLLGNCFTIKDKIDFHYEFDIRGMEALIKCDYLPLINEAIDEFRKYNKYVNVFYNEDRSFYKAYDEIHTFKLPINIIQPSKIFIANSSFDSISKYLEDKEVYLPVTILNDEYVLLDGHARLYAKYNEDFKMVNVYLDDSYPILDDLVYMAKEQNITKINNLNVLSDEEYKEYLEFINSLKEI